MSKLKLLGVIILYILVILIVTAIIAISINQACKPPYMIAGNF